METVVHRTSGVDLHECLEIFLKPLNSYQITCSVPSLHKPLKMYIWVVALYFIMLFLLKQIFTQSIFGMRTNQYICV